MRFRDKVIWFVCVVLAAASFVAAGTQLDFINAKRQDMGLILDKPENVPPSLAFATVATGAFRGLLVDVLWIRADKLKEEGQFFDAKQLADWITILQPRFATVWEFQAWNMAYNISVTIPATRPDQRWRWVKNGYELLRDKGIEKNPKSILLYRELARTFQHKIGSISDDAHRYYKLQLALAMEPLVGSEDNRYFEALSEAPTEWVEVIKDEEVLQLIKALKSADRTFADDDSFAGNYLALRRNPGRFEPAAFRVIDDFRGTKSLQKFDFFAKAFQLRNIWKLDPVLMHELNRIYGPVTDWDDPNSRLPLDWRHPDTHAIYWAAKGLQMAGKGEYSPDETNTDRIVVHSLHNLFRYGKIFIYDVPMPNRTENAPQTEDNNQLIVTKDIFLRPDLRMFEPYNKAILAVLEKYKVLRETTYEAMRNGYRNMLKNAVFSFYQAGSYDEDPHRRKAKEIYEQLRQDYPDIKDFQDPLVVYVRKRLGEEIKSLGIFNAREMILMLLREAYFRYAVHDDNEAFSREKWAEEAYQIYVGKFPDVDRVKLLEFPQLRYLALRDFLDDWQYPPNLRRNLLGRIKIERPDLYKKLKLQEEILIKQQPEG